MSKFPGTIQTMPEAEYHARPELSNSMLWTFRQSPAKMIWDRSNSASTSAQVFGSAAHAKILENKDFLVAEQCSAILKNGKRCSKMGSLYLPSEITNGMLGDTGSWYCKTSGHAADDAYEPVDVISEGDRDMIAAMQERFIAHPAASILLVGANVIEASIFFPYEGVDCRSRIDILNAAKNYAADYKTTRSLEDWGVEYCGRMRDEVVSRLMYNYGYYRQAAFYLAGLAACGIFLDNFIFIVQEKTPPYDLAVLRISGPALSLARQELEQDVLDYRTCLEADEWPGAGPDHIIDVDLPPYAYTT